MMLMLNFARLVELDLGSALKGMIKEREGNQARPSLYMITMLVWQPFDPFHYFQITTENINLW